MDRNAPESQNPHLTEDQIDELAFTKDQGHGNLAQQGWLNSHLASCATCRQAVEVREKELDVMRGTLAGTTQSTGRGCPSSDVWLLVVAGLDDSPELAEHAIVCARCGPLLRQALDDATAENTPEEARVASSLPSSQPGMARKIARQLVASGADRPAAVPPASNPYAQSVSTSRGSGWTIFSAKYVFAAICLLAIATAAFVYWGLEERRNDPDRVLARSYTAQRTLAWRFPGAEHAPLQMNRGQQARRTDSNTPSLLRLEARTTEGLTSNPNDPRLLATQGRLALLNWKREEAITLFRRVADLKPQSATALIDLAAAYFERAEATGHDFDYGTAIDLMSKALQIQPGNSVALFNRALASERMYLYGRAAADWEEFLKMEPTGAWAAEAKDHLAEIKKKLNAP